MHIHQRFGKLVANSRMDKRWLCTCDCGRRVLVTATALITNKKRHCGMCEKPRKSYGVRPSKRYTQLSEKEKLDIYDMRRLRISYADIDVMFNVSPSVVDQVVFGKGK